MEGDTEHTTRTTTLGADYTITATPRSFAADPISAAATETVARERVVVAAAAAAAAAAALQSSQFQPLPL